MGFRHLIVFIWVLTLPGCGSKTASLCGSSGGTCCQVLDKDKKQVALHCRRSYEACKADVPQEGSFVWDYSTNDAKAKKDNYCERQTRTVGFWAEDPFEYLVRAALKSDLPASVTSAQGKPIAQGEAEYCRALCLTHDAGLCPELPLRSDVSLANLMMMQRVAENPPNAMYVYPIDQILATYRVSPDTNLCARGDLLVTPTSSINVGPFECNSQIQQISSVGEIDVELVSPKNVASTFIADAKIASYELDTASFSLKVNDTSLSPYFSGPIRYTGRMSETEIFAQISASKRLSCASIVPIVDRQHDLKSLSDAVEKDPSLPAAGLRILTEYRASVRNSGSKALQEDVDHIKISDEMLPYSAYLAALQRTALKHGVNAPLPKTVQGDNDKTKTVESLLRLVDVYVCNQQYKNTPIEQLIPLIPIATRDNINLDLLDRREAIAAEILQCKYSAAYISARSRELISAALQAAPTEKR